MDKKIKRLISAVIVLGFIVIGLGGYIIYDKYVVKPSAKIEKKEDKTNKIDFDASKYLSYVPIIKTSDVYNHAWGFNDHDVIDYVDAYSKDKVTIDDIDEVLMLQMAIERTTKAPDSEKFESDFGICGIGENGEQLSCTISEYYKADDVLSNVRLLYNKEVTPKDFSYKGGLVYYRDGYFAIGYGSGNNPVEKVSNLEKSEIVGDDLILYERAIFIYELATKFENAIEVTYKTNYDNDDILVTTDSISDTESVNEAKDAAYANIENSNLFKHTFKKNAKGEYYWYSTEIVK